ncbi:Phd_YefM [Caballeronia peredens]|nr:Phd_YefM [Caballeronia peredens]
MKPSQVRPISYLKRDAAAIVKELSETREPLLITQNGEAKLVVQDAQSYEDLQQTVALLKILALGQRDIQAGNYRNIDDFFAELDAEDEAEDKE